MKFTIDHKTYELVKVDEPFGYDIYDEDNEDWDDPINLGEVAYFNQEPTQKDIEEYLTDFQEII